MNLKKQDGMYSLTFTEDEVRSDNRLFRISVNGARKLKAGWEINFSAADAERNVLLASIAGIPCKTNRSLYLSDEAMAYLDEK